MSIQGYFLAVLLLLLIGTTPLTAQRHTTSLFFTGNLIFNNNEEQWVGDYGITFGNPNLGLSAELTRRYYGKKRLSLETGLQLSTRNFKTIAFDRRDATLPGRITEGYPLSLSVPLPQLRADGPGEGFSAQVRLRGAGACVSVVGGLFLGRGGAYAVGSSLPAAGVPGCLRQRGFLKWE